jgi:hypothetical protein
MFPRVAPRFSPSRKLSTSAIRIAWRFSSIGALDSFWTRFSSSLLNATFRAGATAENRDLQIGENI